MAEELKYPQAFPLPVHGGFDGLYDLSDILKKDMGENNIEGLAFVGRDIVQINTPNFEVTPPYQIEFRQEDDTTDRWTIRRNINGKEYVREYVIKLTGRGTDNEQVETMLLPNGSVITFVNV